MFTLRSPFERLPSIGRTSARALASLALLGLTCYPVQASEESKSSRNPACFDEAYENVHPECTQVERRELHARFDLPPIERFSRQQRAQGDVIIAYYWTKIGGGTAFALHRNRRGRVQLELRLVPIGSRHRSVIGRRIRITHETWLELVAKAHSVDFSYRPETICVGGASIMLEVMSGPGRVHTRRHDLCDLADDVRLYFHDLAGVALAALPQCARFGRDDNDRLDADAVLHRCLVPSGSRK